MDKTKAAVAETKEMLLGSGDLYISKYTDRKSVV